MKRRRIVPERRLGSGERRKRLVIDGDCGGSVGGGVRVFRQHDRHRITHVAHSISRERIPFGRVHVFERASVRLRDDRKRKLQERQEIVEREDGEDSANRKRRREASMRFTRACAYGLRTKAIEAAPARGMSAV